MVRNSMPAISLSLSRSRSYDTQSDDGDSSTLPTAGTATSTAAGTTASNTATDEEPPEPNAIPVWLRVNALWPPVTTTMKGRRRPNSSPLSPSVNRAPSRSYSSESVDTLHSVDTASTTMSNISVTKASTNLITESSHRPPYEWKRGWLLENAVSGDDSSEKQTVTVWQQQQQQDITDIPSNSSSNTTNNNNNNNNSNSRLTVDSATTIDVDIMYMNSAQTIPQDLVTLTHFSEPTVVECLWKRYQTGHVYTATGPVLVACNPFCRLESLYANEVMSQYWDRAEQAANGGSSKPALRKTTPATNYTNDEQQEQSLPPHVFSIADNAFRSMMRGLEVQLTKVNPNTADNADTKTQQLQQTTRYDQSILVSGESGAGKTVTTKFVLRYLATLSQRTTHQAKGQNRAYKTVTQKTPTDTTVEDNKSIESQVLQSNPILESFGNARTVRNDNSSRFGKYIELQFHQGRLVGTKIETYLLEKVRVVQQNPGERNYHIFYEILNSLNSIENADKEYHLLGTDTAETYKLLNNSGTAGIITTDRRDGILDKDTFSALRKAFSMMNFTKEERNLVFQVTCSVLHASNIIFQQLDDDSCKLSSANNNNNNNNNSDRHISAVCDLLGVTLESLEQALCTCSIVVAGSLIQRPLNVDRAEKGLQAFLKALYSALFNKLVEHINESIAYKGGDDTKMATIGILDIFGFETFSTNRFEQLCINYTNEALQQQFNTFMLKNQQAQIASEGIDWDFITFPENQDVLDLIDHKTDGILSLLDDMCKTPNATDLSFARTIYNKHGGDEENRFHASQRQQSQELFSVNHYAGKVEYTLQGFVEKNRDDMPKEASDLLMSSTKPFVQSLVPFLSLSSTTAQRKSNTNGSSNAAANSNSGPKLTVGGFFRQQLRNLRSKLEATAPHYIRCIKPNDELVPHKFDDAMVVEQLRCGGILQAVSVTRSGFSLNYDHVDFLKRFKNLAPKHIFAPKDEDSNKPMTPAAQCRILVEFLLEKLEKKTQTADAPIPSPTKSKANTKQKVKSQMENTLIQVGKSKVLLKHSASQRLEQMHVVVQNASATKINSIHRRFLSRVAYLCVRDGFRRELARQGMTFPQWFKDHREIYYQQKKQQGGVNIPMSIVSKRKALIQQKLSKTFDTKFESLPPMKVIDLDNSAWVLAEGLWKRNAEG